MIKMDEALNEYFDKISSFFWKQYSTFRVFAEINAKKP